MTTAAWGATPEQWQRWVDLGVESDLLPVVSNPQARIAPDSKMKGLGKTPSRYNRNRMAVGIPAWTTHFTTSREIDMWQRDPDLGICVQTRLVRAIDIDIEDPERAAVVRDAVELIAGDLPMRMRSDSGKCLLVFKMEGEFTKRVLRTEHGPVEFLANGQQFVAVGTHPKGTRYDWPRGLPDDIPYLSSEEFEALWATLESSFGIAATVSRGPGARPLAPRRVSEVTDDVLSFLERTGWVRNSDSQGRAHIICPWESEHTTGEGGDGDSSTTYFPRGVGGFEQGHFRCLHAHCEGRTDGDFLEAVGYLADGFEVVEPQPGESEVPLLLPPFERNRQGEILANVANLEMALRRADVTQVHIGYDEFKDELMLAPFGTKQWRQFTDADYVRLRIRLERGGFKPIGRELIRDVVGMVAEDCQFDSAQMWLGDLKWDGVPRVERFFVDFFSAEDSQYIRNVGLYLWTALAGRVLEPGVKADMAVILVGAQGVGKTTGVAAIVPSEEHFMEVKFDDDETALARRMRGKLIGEIGELRGLHSREIEHIKAFVSRTHEEWVPKFKEFSTQFARRLAFVGTTNNEEFLADETGERRWLPLRVGEVDVAGIKRMREQLWAEAAILFLAGGVQWRDAQSLARDVHGEFTMTDPWDEAIRNWLCDTTFGEEGKGVANWKTNFTASQVLAGAIGKRVGDITRGDEMRASRVLKRLGFVTTRTRVAGHQVRVYQAAENCEFAKSCNSEEFA